MKSIKLLYVNLLMVNLLFMAGCTDEFITKPFEYGTQSDITFRRTVNGLLMTVNAAYSPLGGEYWQQYPTDWLIVGQNRSDDSHAGGENENDDVNAHSINDFNIYPTNPVFYNFWKQCYFGINSANQVIYSADGAIEANPDAESILKITNYVGQAKCLRAYYYFDLVRQFGDLPLVLDASTALRPRSPRLLIYDQIEKDLKEAAAVLPKYNELSAEEKGRMNNGSALAILAKVYLFRASLEPDKANEYYTKSYQTAKEVIDSKQFKLLTTYDAIWRNTGDFSTESIVDGGQPLPANRTGYSSWFAIYQSPRYYYKAGTKTKIGSDWGWGFNCPTQDFVNSFEPGDPRKNWSIFMQGDSSKCGSKLNKNQEICFDNSTSGYYNRKYTYDVYPSSGNNSLNIKFYRYADLILVGAEAANEIGQTADALAWLELIRSRARTTPAAPNHINDKIAGAPTVVTETDKSSLRKIIWHERRIELGLEAHRFYDLVRWNGMHGFDWANTIQTAQAIAGPNYQIDNDALSGVARKGRSVIVEDKHLLSPIPDSEIKSTNNTLIQNSGY